MNPMDVLMERISVRDFTDEPVSDSDLESILKAAMQAPSARNQQAWEFLVVDDPSLIRELAKASPYAGPVSRAPMAVVVMGDRGRMTVPQMWDQDMGACIENLMVKARELGLGTCWIGILPLEDRMAYISELFSLPEDMMPSAIVAVGHPAEPMVAKEPRYDPARVHRNGF